MAEVIQGRARQISMEDALPFSQRLDALNAFALFFNSSKPILDETLSVLQEVDLDACAEASAAIHKEIACITADPKTRDGNYPNLEAKISGFAEKIEGELQGNRRNKLFFDHVLTVMLDGPGWSDYFKQAHQSAWQTFQKTATRMWGDVRAALIKICQEYSYGAVVIVKHPLMYTGVLAKIQETYDTSMAALSVSTAKAKEKVDAMNREISQIEDEAEARLFDINTEITSITDQVTGSLLELQTDMMSAQHDIDAYIEDSEQHLDEMQEKIDDGIGLSDDAKNEQNTKESPAGQHLENSKQALFDWENGDLHSTVVAAQRSATEAAEAGKKAAAVYEELMKGNQLSFGTIEGDADWGDGDIAFDIKCIFEFILRIDLGFLDIDINTGAHELFHLSFKLSDITDLFDHVFKYLWESITDAW